MNLTCDICGGTLVMDESRTFARCADCGVQYPIELLRAKVQGTTRMSDTPTPEDGIPAHQKMTDAVSETGRMTDAIPDGLTIQNGTVVRYTGSATELVLPEGITAIGEGAFGDCDSLTSLHLPASVTKIGDYAFNGCSNLVSIHLPDSVTELGPFTFNGCSSLTTIHLPARVTEIGDFAFNGCSSLVSVNIPDSVTEIAGTAFAGCYTLRATWERSGLCPRCGGTLTQPDHRYLRKTCARCGWDSNRVRNIPLSPR